MTDYLLAHDKEIYPRLCAYLLPVGMLGLIIAAMFSATMGNLSSHFNVRASVLTNDVYRRLCRPHAGEKELVTAGRAMTIVVGGLTILMAIMLAAASAENLFKYMVSLFGGAVAPLGLPLLVGLVSRRVTPRSVAVAVIVGVILAVSLFLDSACFDHDPGNHLREGSHDVRHQLRHGDGDHVRDERDLADDRRGIATGGTVPHAVGDARRRLARGAGGRETRRTSGLPVRHRRRLRRCASEF